MSQGPSFPPRNRYVRGLAPFLALIAAFLSVSRSPGALAVGPSAAEGFQKAGAPPTDVNPLLARVAEYCRRLEGAALDFICREEIAETIDPSLDIPESPSVPTSPLWMPGGTAVVVSRLVRNIKNSYVYDYQCIRAAGSLREVRTLIKENGKAKNEANARLKTSVVVFGTALMAPVGLFGERFQRDYDFVVVGQDKIGKAKVLVVDAHPKPGAPESRNLYGKAWVDPVTADILRIEWSESRVGRFDIFEKRGERYNRKPRLTIRSEFSAEKNRIRFPSRLFVEEAYLNQAGRAAVRSKTDVRYTDFKFFKVEVDVRY